MRVCQNKIRLSESNVILSKMKDPVWHQLRLVPNVVSSLRIQNDKMEAGFYFGTPSFSSCFILLL